MRMLVAEDDRSVAAALASALSRAGHSCLIFARGSDVLLHHREADVVLLDLGLLDMDGFELLRKLREVSDVAVIVVTSRADEHSTVRALLLGADDYLVKPVRMHELLARVEAVSRRHMPIPPREVVDVGAVHLDLAAQRATSAGSEIALTRTEFAILAVLVKKRGQVVSRAQMLDEVWGDAYAANSRALDVHLAQVRQKSGVNITTIRGCGYRLEDEQ